MSLWLFSLFGCPQYSLVWHHGWRVILKFNPWWSQRQHGQEVTVALNSFHSPTPTPITHNLSIRTLYVLRQRKWQKALYRFWERCLVSKWALAGERLITAAALRDCGCVFGFLKICFFKLWMSSNVYLGSLLLYNNYISGSAASVLLFSQRWCHVHPDWNSNGIVCILGLARLVFPHKTNWKTFTEEKLLWLTLKQYYLLTESRHHLTWFSLS